MSTGHSNEEGGEQCASNAKIKQKKAPGAPKRFKSAYIFFSCEKHKEMKSLMGNASKVSFLYLAPIIISLL